MQVELIDSKAAHIANTICNASRECFNEKQFMEFCKERLDEDGMDIVERLAKHIKEAAA